MAISPVDVFYKTPAPRVRLISLIVLVLFTVAAVVMVSPLAFLSAWAAIVMIYVSIWHPDSPVAIQQDDRAFEEVVRFNKFVDILAAGGVIDADTTEEDIKLDMPAPLVYTVALHQIGKTMKQLDAAVKNSLDAMGAVSVEIRRTAPSEYVVVFSEFPPVDELAAVEVSFSSLLSRVGDVDINHLPLGVYQDGSPVLASLASRNGLLAGVMGSGKSVCLSALVCALLRCNRPGDVCEEVVIISPKILDFQKFKGACRLISSYDDIFAYLEDLAAEVERRKALCIEAGVKKISPDMAHHITLIVDEYTVLKTGTLTDEKGKVLKVGETFEAALMRLLAEARFASVSIVIALQKADSRNIDTRTRDLISGVRCSFAAEGKTSAEMVFGEFACNAPCHEIGMNAPGVGYIQLDADCPKPFKGAFADDDDELAAAEYALSCVRR